MNNSKTLHTNSRNKGKKHTNDIPILRERLEQLRSDKGYTQKEVAKKIGCSYESYQAWINPRYQGYKDDYTYVTPSIDKLMALSELYGVSIDYLVGKTDYTSVDNEMISNVTGLSDDSIENIKAIRLRGAQDDYMNCVVTDMFTGGMIRKTPRFIVTNTLNKLLSSPYFESILYAVDDFINTHYNIPVHYEKAQPHIKPGWYENNQQIYNGSDMCMSFACDKSNLSDTRDMVVSDTFLESVALKDIEKALYEIKKGCL